MLSNNDDVVKVKDKISSNAHIDWHKYQEMYLQSINEPEQFWHQQAKIITWYENFDRVKVTSFGENPEINWFLGGKLNVCYNAVDRHLASKGQQTAIIWEADDSDESKHITYNELYENVVSLASGLKQLGVKKGDRVIIYLPMIPEAAYAMLACARIGAIHSVVFAGFSPETLRSRIEDCEASYIITADEGVRGGKNIPLKQYVDQALDNSFLEIKKVIMVERTNVQLDWNDTRDIKYNQVLMKNTLCSPEIMDAADPLFILYTSGSTGKPKGVQHNSGGYAVYAAVTHKYIFDYHDGDIYWCTADIGWITGHSYAIYGPLINGATTLMFEGVPSYPDYSRFWQIIDKHKVNIFYTAPTALRTLMKESEEYINKSSRDSLRILGSVGEPINPEVWRWYHDVIGKSQCAVIDSWWQTETGGILISPLPGATDTKPGSSSLPFFGVQPVLVDENGNILEGEAEGYLCIKDSWPGQMCTVYKQHQLFYDNYFSRFKNLYFSGDGARRDKDGYYWITGRVDDVLNVSGHRIGTAEVENIIVSHPAIAEAAVVGCPHPIKGQGIYIFVTVKSSIQTDDSLKKELIALVRKQIGPIATPDFIQWANALPKTRSGKIMRRLLRKIAADEHENFGDTNTLTNPEVINELIAGKMKISY